MRAGDDGIHGPIGASIMANAVCQNGSKCIPVDSGPRSFSLSSVAHLALRRLKQSNEREREFCHAMQIARDVYFKLIETKLRFPLF
ncbi:hypothetical protein OKW38_002031 [Paraburkholderia sp. MM5496-R1]|uniref:Uncharacterized protein n=1 Tax=Paraburkholderia tuberum TaxID=157910 RepID=A0A1H1H8T3_9BURK|nr:hypothetical protein [Paraburkholderia tuberum]SDR21867.1 hypothetical protein SAMN05445850_3363 [Paraburkholderia tuberum]